jgi:hypothetical protein
MSPIPDSVLAKPEPAPDQNGEASAGALDEVPEFPASEHGEPELEDAAQTEDESTQAFLISID